MKVFGKVQKKTKLNHSSWACVQALLQRWPTPRVHISTTSLITRSTRSWQCHLLPAAMSKTAVSNWRASSSSSSVTKRVTASRLEAIAGPWYFFFQTCCAPFVENARSSSAGRYGRTTNLRLQKHWKRKRESPGEINVERFGQDR